MIMPVATRRQRSSSSSLTAVIFLITVGLVAKVCNGSGGIENPASYNEEEQHVSPSQKYFDAVAPEDRVNFIKYHLDLALEQRYADYVRQIQPDFSFVNYGEPVEPPANFTANLLNHFHTSYGLTDNDVVEIVRSHGVVCFPQGWCFDPDDVGTICCPF